MSIRITDIIDVRSLQEMEEGFSAATGMAAIITDADGRPVTNGSGFNDYIRNVMKKSGKGNDCIKKASHSGRVSVTINPAGLVEFAVPLVLGADTAAVFSGGYVLPEAPDDGKLRRAAREVNADPDEFVKNVRKLQVVPKGKVESYADFVNGVMNVISGIAGHSSDDRSSHGGFGGSQTELKRKLKFVSDIINDNTKSMNKLSEKFTELKKTSSDSLSEVNATKDTVKVIEDVASNTRILGFNASIEASLAKESGKGFGVIAQEVRSLAETSKMSADKIDEAMNKIREYTSKINENVQSTEEIVEGSLKNMQEFTTVVSDIEKMLG